MSANLWDVSAANFKPDADGVYICGTSTGELDCSIADASALTENQTIHMSASLRRAYNLLRGTGDGTWASAECTKDSATAFGTKVVSCVRNSSKQYQSMNDTTVSGLVPRKGDSVTLSFWCMASAECTVVSYLYSDSGTGGNAKKHNEAGGTIPDGNVTTKVGTEWTYARHTWTYDEDAGRAPRSIAVRLMGGVPDGVTVSIAGVMLVEGDTPAAWAPAEGEDIECLKPFVEYKDAAGNLNWVGFPAWTPNAEWQRFDGSCVVPSGMTITRIGFNISGATGNMEVTNPVWSYGSMPLTLASAEHTHQVPYVPVLYTYETDVPSKVELTYTDASFHDVGVLVPSSGDFAWGTDENDFSIDVYGSDLPERGGLLYAEGSDVGGVVRGFESETDSDLFSIVGDTWTGVLERHVIGPPSGSDYLTISGEARDCVAQVVALTGLTSLYVVDERRTGISFTHTFTGSRDEAESDAGRYMGAWSAIWQMMLNHGLSVSFAWDGTAKKVRMVVGRRADRTSDEEQQAGVSKLGITRKDVTNHLICLGQGNLRNRTRVDLYIDGKGNVSKTQTFKGLDELADVYDDSAAEDASKLEEDGRKKFAEIWKDHEQITDTASKGLQLNLGDLVGGTDERSGISATAIISKRVLSFSDGVPSYTYTTTVRSK
jgi:hypothetical protein